MNTIWGDITTIQVVTSTNPHVKIERSQSADGRWDDWTAYYWNESAWISLGHAADLEDAKIIHTRRPGT